MIHYGIELEFFIKDKEGVLVPAYKQTYNLDGNPLIGELRTAIHSNIIECIFELKMKLFVERKLLADKGFNLVLEPQIEVDGTLIKSLRSDASYINRKEHEVLEEKSIYGKDTGKVLPTKTYKASLQVNMSDNYTFDYDRWEQITVENKSRWRRENASRSHSEVFDYFSIISKLDKQFATEIKEAKRVKGVYAIKDGLKGKRIEYRSLPNNIDLDKLINAL